MFDTAVSMRCHDYPSSNNATYEWYKTVRHTCDDDHLALEAGQVLVVDLKLGHGIDTTLLW